MGRRLWCLQGRGSGSRLFTGRWGFGFIRLGGFLGLGGGGWIWEGLLRGAGLESSLRLGMVI
jgi:hypothetical protein